VAPVFLIGFMAAGKTSVGRALGEATGRRFVDLDDVISERAGESVSALVARDEVDFRRREAEALRELVAAGGDVVIATGGGAAVHGDNLDRMRAAGLVVALGVDVEEARARATAQGRNVQRPLFAKADQLAIERAPHYRRAHAVVDTTGKAVVEIVGQVQHIERVWRETGRDATILALGERSYAVTVGEDAVDGELLRAQLAGVTKVGVVTDAAVAQHWMPALAAALGEVPHHVVTIAPGETSKTLATYQRVIEELVAAGLDRRSTIIALGGGVVGDLAGFVAATLYRGIPVIQLPTTIVAMTDAAIGGKTAVDLPAGKNLAGAFWQPRLVACGLATLATLPARERRAGFGELWKYALLDGPALWAAVDACAAWAHASETGGSPPPELTDVIRRAIAYKAAIVGRDEREVTGQRALLNLGHTVGHAIESASGMLHGEAVGLGLVAACRVSAALGLATPGLTDDVTAALARTGLPVDLGRYLDDDILARVQVDKKRIGANLRFIAIRQVGACEPVEIAVTELRRILLAKPTP
jgi:shikimate kinase/3-dehydroquinate synthase